MYIFDGHLVTLWHTHHPYIFGNSTHCLRCRLHVYVCIAVAIFCGCISILLLCIINNILHSHRHSFISSLTLNRHKTYKRKLNTLSVRKHFCYFSNIIIYKYIETYERQNRRWRRQHFFLRLNTYRIDTQWFLVFDVTSNRVHSHNVFNFTIGSFNLKIYKRILFRLDI